MELFERELFLYRLLAGYLRFKSDNVNLKIITPPLEVIYESQEVYNDIYMEAKSNSCLTQEELTEMMMDKGLWQEEDNEQLNVVLPKHIEFWKVEIYQNFHKKADREKSFQS